MASSLQMADARPPAYRRAMERPLAPSPAHAIIAVLLLWLAGLGAAMQFAKIGVPFEEFRAMFPAAGARIGWLLSLVSLIGAVFGMMAGIAVTGFGLRRSLLAAMLLGGAVSALQSTLTGLGPLLASRVIEGASHLVIVVAAPTLIAQLSPLRMRGFFMTLWATFFGVAYALMAWLGMDFIAEHGIPALFRLHGMTMILLAALLWLVLPVEPRHASAALPSLAEILRAQLRAIRSPWIAAPGFGWLFYTLTFVSLLAILPALVPADRRDFVTGTLPLISIAASLGLVPALLGWLAPTTVVMLGFAGAALGAAGLFVTPDPTWAAAAVFFGLGLVQGASFAAVPALNHSAADRALSNGLMAQTGNLGNLLGTPLLLVVQAHAGQNGLVVTILCGYLTAILCHLWMARRRAAALRI
jgi:DHA1 family inner membrane transport protein